MVGLSVWITILTTSMTNAYTVVGSCVSMEIRINRTRKAVCLFDTEDLPVVSSIPGTWQAVWAPSAHTYYVFTTGIQGEFPGKRRAKDRLYLHRVVMNAPVEKDVDHLHHNGLDNRKEELVIRSRSQNLLNRRGAQSNSKTGFLGVVHGIFDRGKGNGQPKTGYRAQLRINGKKYRSSVRRTPEEASAWYWAKRHELGIPDPEQKAA